jgi:hypothetical protein
MCEIYRNQSALLWSNDVLTKQEKYFDSIKLKEDFIKELSNIEISTDTIRKIIEQSDTKLQRKILVSLFVAHKDKVVELLKSSSENISTLKRVRHDEDGKNLLYLYGKKHENLQKWAVFDKLDFENVEISTQNDPNSWA